MTPKTNEELIELLDNGKIEEFTQNGLFEYKDVEIDGQRLVVRANFKAFSQAYKKLISVGDKGADFDLIGAGDVILNSAIFGGKEILSRVRSRMKATQILGLWVAEVMGDDLEDSEQKKTLASE